MSEPAFEDELEDALPSAAQSPPDGELVHWMEPRPMSVGAGGISATAAGAFLLGMATSVAVLALLHWLGPDRELEIPTRRRFWS